MPFIDSKVTVSLSKAQKDTMKAGLGRACAAILGKAENWLMVGFEDNYELYFQGNQEQPSAFVEVKAFGRIADQAAAEMTREICRIYEEELQIPQNRVYVKYESVSQWGWNGGNL